MQTSLLLLGYALTRYVRDLSRTVSAVIAAFTVLGLLFYLFVVVTIRRDSLDDLSVPDTRIPRSSSHLFPRKEQPKPLATEGSGSVICDGSFQEAERQPSGGRPVRNSHQI
jgi:hypothetical protein